jgi:hypothetical protein
VVGRWVRFHPLAIILAITVGGVVAGIPGAAVAVPTAAVIYRAIPALRGSPDPTPAETPAKPPSLARGRGTGPSGTEPPDTEPPGTEPSGTEPEPSAPEDKPATPRSGEPGPDEPREL